PGQDLVGNQSVFHATRVDTIENTCASFTLETTEGRPVNSSRPVSEYLAVYPSSEGAVDKTAIEWLCLTPATKQQGQAQPPQRCNRMSVQRRREIVHLHPGLRDLVEKPAILERTRRGPT